MFAFVAVLAALATLPAGAAGAGTSVDGKPQPRERTLTLTPGHVSAPPHRFFPRAGFAEAADHHARPGSLRQRLATVRRQIPPHVMPRFAFRPATTYTTSVGYRVTVQLSSGYSEGTGRDRELVAFLESLLHGPELDGLRVIVATRPQLRYLCGAGAAACYFPFDGAMAIAGEDEVAGLPTDYLIAHEYGHRIAQFSRNPPFRNGALFNGPKRWATAAKVCPLIEQGRVSRSPFSYWRMAGENFAEAYAQLHMPDAVVWQYTPLLRPTRETRNAIALDVLDPWQRPRKFSAGGRVSPRRATTITVPTPLDGRLVAELTFTRGAPVEVALAKRGRLVSRMGRASRGGRLSTLICGQRSIEIRVRAGGRRAAAFSLEVWRP